ncbi:Fungal specific transcription factor domain [Geosmithia morbida]|uniref:Fungal specific transcription factor domain n=1 Tax=Geosmithia morbida TaxID=1094350 RepID=A0A9P4Z2H8_9HYPO|nr:Fungal specific transcription factor domain [Geosmithia morbida]KAF4126232.1 Fungal specific transcription factor domain [Geosmithia morbida]
MDNSRKVKFVEVDTTRGGLPVKRKQVQQACTSIHHALTRLSTGARSPSSARGGRPTHSNGAGPRRSSANAYADPFAPSTAPPSTTPTLNEEPAKLRSRFVSDLNPESMFFDATEATSTREMAQKGDVGIWLSSTVNGSSAGHPSQFITSRPPPIMDHFLLPFVKEHCLTCYPPEEDFAKLRHIFVQKIHPIFPIIPLEALDGNPNDSVTILLRQLVSLAAGTDPDGSQYLRLKNKGPDLFTPPEFSQALSSSVRAILETSIIADRVLHIRSLTMLSLYTQPTCAEESDLPAQLGGRAIQHIQTLGLHLLRYDAPNSDDLENLFCAVWALDRMNGAMYGRPYLIHERDIGTNLDACIKKRPPCFRLFLLICQWLDQVIDLYRPGPSAETSSMAKVAYIDLPVLEALIVEADALREPSSLIGRCPPESTFSAVICTDKNLPATIETFYHSVSILSCRLPRPGTFPAATTLPPPSANARRSLSAERIACAVPRDCLSPVPFVPHAVSLALSVEYRKMRHSRLPMFRARAMTAFRRNCQILREFGDYFWSANVVADLGERILKEMERASTTLAREASPSVAAALPPSGDGSRGSAQAATGRDNNDAGGVAQWRPRGELAAPGPMAMHMAAGMNNFVDFSAIDSASGQDLFDHIDPNFNLTAVEDVLEAHLDIGLPLNWGEWGQYTA